MKNFALRQFRFFGASTRGIIEPLESRIAPALASPFPLGSVNGANGANGFHLSGLGASGFGERPAAVAGDVNGDGFDDVIFGATALDAAFVVFGKADGFPADLNLTTLDGTNGFRIDGTATSFSFGQAVSGAGDLNGDGFADIVIGAFNETIGARGQAGAAYVVFGKATFAATFSIAALDGANGFKVSGVAAGDQAGSSVGAAGDLNGDGFDDVAIGALGADVNGANSGAAYIVFGHAGGFAANLKLNALDGANGFRIAGAAASDFFGRDPSAAGDVNGDGFGDFIVGAQGADAAGVDSGAAYVIFGKANFAASVNVSALIGPNGFRLRGAAAGDRAGFSVAGGGDVNGDGFADVVVGAFGAKANGLYSGAAYVVFGKGSPFSANVPLATLSGANGFRIVSEEAQALTGYSVHLADDVNGDGFDDVIVSAPGSSGRASNATSYVVYGAPTFAASLPLASLDGTNGVKLLRVLADDSSGSNVAGGDINGDGFEDIVSSDLFGGHVVFGSASPAVTQVGDKTANTLTGNVNPNILIGGAAGDSLLGNGGADVLRGGQGADLFAVADLGFFKIAGRLGVDTLRLDGAGLALNLTTFPHSKIAGIERIDLTGSGANTLTLTAREVLNLSPTTNTLTVLGNADDFVNFGAGWIREANQTDGATTLKVFTNGAATLRIADAAGTSAASGYVLSLAGNGLPGLTVNGVAANDQARLIGSAGDVNGDGFDDFLISAFLAAPNGALSGAAYVVFGKAGSFTSPLELSSLDGTNGFAIRGAASLDELGESIGAAGDFNGDGFGDIIVGAFGVAARTGAAYLIYGKSGAFAPALEVSSLNGLDGFKLRGAGAKEYTGVAVHSAGDVNGDGFDDVVIGASFAKTGAVAQTGRAYVVFGRAASPGATLDLASLNGTNGFTVAGVTPGARVGDAVSGGDVNGDGFSDVILGSSEEKTFVVFGKAATFPAKLAVTALNGANGFTIDGGSLNGRTGQSVSAAGDVNGDGLGDLLIGAPFTNGPGGITGAAFVVFGKAGATFGATVNLAALTGANGFRISGKDAGDKGEYAGQSVSAAGDVNGDGFDDVIVGAAFTDSRGVQSGEAYVIYGGTGFAPVFKIASLDGTNGFALLGDIPGARAGGSVSGAGDVNGDGFNDVLVGSYGPLTGPNAPGRGYLVFGFDSGKVTQRGDAGANTFTGTAGRDVIVAGQGHDTVLNGGFTDVLRGGQGDDNFTLTSGPLGRLVGGHGFDTLTLTNGLLLDLTARPVYRINGFEQVDLRTGANSLSLDARALLNFSPDTNTLIVRANADDIVNIGKLTDWTALGTEVIDGDTFTVLRQGAAILKVSSFIAPVVTLVDATTATYTDVDGDRVTIKTSKGTLGLSDFFLFSSGTVGGAQLAAINFSDDGNEFKNADLTITAKRTALGGDGRVNVGRIDASGVDLQNVRVEGDLRTILAGDANLATPGLDALTLLSMGRYGLSTQGSGGIGTSLLLGELGALNIASDLVDAAFSVFVGAGKIGFGAVNIGGSILGGGAAFTGLYSPGATGAIVIGQDIRGGSGFSSGSLFIQGSIASLTVGGSVVGGGAAFSGGVLSLGTLGAVKIGGDLESSVIVARDGIASAAITGSVLNSRILAGYDLNLAPVNADATIGAVTVGGDWVASSLVAGAAAGDAFFGNGGDVLIAGGNPAKVATIASIAIAGQVLGTVGGADSFGFVAEKIVSFSVGGTVFPLTAGRSNDLAGLDVGATFDVKVREVNATPAAPSGSGSSGGGTFPLSSLDGANGFRLNGTPTDFDVGRIVAAAGDVNGDGFGDFIVGAPGGNTVAGIAFGEAYVVFGRAGGSPPVLATTALDGTNGFRINDSVPDDTHGPQLGLGVGGAGDVNGDGFDDVIVGEIANDGLNGTREAAFVIFGKASGFTATVDVNALNGANGFTLTRPLATDPNFSTFFRMSVSGVGDLNRDGFDDVAIGAVNADFASQNAGAVFVYFGKATQPASVDLTTLNGTNGFRFDGATAFANLGYSVSRAGDVNGDGFDDLIAGANRAKVGASSNGSAYVIYGKSAAFPASFSPTALDGANGFRIPGLADRADTGNLVSGGGDVNGDGFSDIVIGAPYAGPAFNFTGESYVVFGKKTSVSGNFPADFSLASLNGANGFKITGESDYDYAGRGVIAGDVNGDGLADILIGAPGLEGKNEFKGGGYVVYGRATQPANVALATLTSAQGFKLLGVEPLDQAGKSVSSAGDFNGDGRADLLIGASLATPNATGTGSVFLVLGGATGAPQITLSPDGKTAIFTDVDGDRVKIKTTAGAFVQSDFTLAGAGKVGGAQLQTLDLNGASHAAFAGVNITISATRTALGGDGFVNVGYVNATGLDLGKLAIEGDLGQIDAGDGTAAKQALAGLAVQSLGRLGTSTQAAGGSLQSDIAGHLGGLVVKSDVVGAFVKITGSANDDGTGAITIGGALRGGAATNTGSLFAAGDIGLVRIGQGIIGGAGAHSGSIEAGGSIVKIVLGNSLIGGAGAASGSLIAGIKIGAIDIGGDASGARIFAKGTLLPANNARAVAIDSLVVRGSVQGSGIFAGYDRDGIAANPDAQIGPVAVVRDWIASNLAAGDFPLPAGNAIVSKIASIAINGQALGTVASGDAFGFAAQQIGAFQIGGTVFPLTAATDAPLPVGATGDLRVRET